MKLLAMSALVMWEFIYQQTQADSAKIFKVQIFKVGSGEKMKSKIKFWSFFVL